MSDLISRQAAIDAVRKEYAGIHNANIDGDFLADEIEFIISKVPAVIPVVNDINVSDIDCIGKKQILVVEAPFYIKKDELKLLRNRIIDQMKSGLVILSGGIRAITCDTDMVKIKGELENEQNSSQYFTEC